jgi:hypothetical protein
VQQLPSTFATTLPKHQPDLPCKKPVTSHQYINNRPCANMPPPPRTVFVNPFKKHDVSEFPGVLQPLDQAPVRPTSASANRRSSAIVDRPESEKAVKKDSADDAHGAGRPDSDASSVVNDGMTIEALRAEIIADLAAADSDTPYDRKSRIINRALQGGFLLYGISCETRTDFAPLEDMGMGRYQWQLFALCGGGWMADNLWLQVRHVVV